MRNLTRRQFLAAGAAGVGAGVLVLVVGAGNGSSAAEPWGGTMYGRAIYGAGTAKTPTPTKTAMPTAFPCRVQVQQYINGRWVTKYVEKVPDFCVSK